MINSHWPGTCGLQGTMLHICSCSGLVSRSHSWLWPLSGVRHRTSLIWSPLPQEREHWKHTWKSLKKYIWKKASGAKIVYRRKNPKSKATQGLNTVSQKVLRKKKKNFIYKNNNIISASSPSKSSFFVEFSGWCHSHQIPTDLFAGWKWICCKM